MLLINSPYNLTSFSHYSTVCTKDDFQQWLPSTVEMNFSANRD